MSFLLLLIFNLSKFAFLFRIFRFFNNLLFKLKSMLFEEFFSFVFELLLEISYFLLFSNSIFKLSFFGSSLLFKHFLFFHLLLESSFFQLSCLFRSDFSLHSFLLSCSPLISLNGSLCSERIEFSLPVRSFLLQLSESLNFLLFLIFYASKIKKLFTFAQQLFMLTSQPSLSNKQQFFIIILFT